MDADQLHEGVQVLFLTASELLDSILRGHPPEKIAGLVEFTLVQAVPAELNLLHPFCRARFLVSTMSGEPAVIRAGGFCSSSWHDYATTISQGFLGDLLIANVETVPGGEIVVPAELLFDVGEYLPEFREIAKRYEDDIWGMEDVLQSHLAIEASYVAAADRSVSTPLLSRALPAASVSSSTTGEPGNKPKQKADEKALYNRNRDQWMYERSIAGAKRALIRAELKNEHPEWEPIDTDPGVTLAVKRYCERNQLDRPARVQG